MLGVTKVVLGVALDTLRIVIAGGMLAGVCLGFDNTLLGDVRCIIFIWVSDRILLGDGFFEQVA